MDKETTELSQNVQHAVAEAGQWATWALELMERLELCQKEALEEPFNIDAAQDRLGTLIEDAANSVTIPCAEPLVMESARHAVKHLAENLRREGNQIGVLRSVAATRTSHWLRALSTALSQACALPLEEEVPEGGQ